MEFTPRPTSLEGIFLSEKFYLIPRYQRKFVWQNDKIEDLWNDIIFSMQESGQVSYFLGSFIFQNEKHSTNKIVIDGQQRLTSLLILFATICKKFRALSDNFNIKETKKYCLLGDKNEKIEKPRIINSDLIIINYYVDYCCSSDTTRTFEEYLTLQHFNIHFADKQFLYCCQYFESQITDIFNRKRTKKAKIQFLENLRDATLKISAVEISVEDEKSASLVFETINARGQALETHELIKNYLFMYERKVKGGSTIKDTWEMISRNTDFIKNSSLSRFIAQYCTAMFGKTAENKLFNTFKKNTQRDNVNERIAHMLDASEIYKNIVTYNNEHYSQETNYYLKCFSDMGIVIIRPLLLSLLFALSNDQITETMLCKYLKKLKNFFSIFVCICENKTNEIEDLIYNAAFQCATQFSINTIDKLILEFKNKITDRQNFIANFSKLAYTRNKTKYPNIKFNKAKCQYVLNEYELYSQSNDDFFISSFSIEHIKDDCLGGHACFIGNMTPCRKRKIAI